jgi:hypothetical protein
LEGGAGKVRICFRLLPLPTDSSVIAGHLAGPLLCGSVVSVGFLVGVEKQTWLLKKMLMVLVLP